MPQKKTPTLEHEHLAGPETAAVSERRAREWDRRIAGEHIEALLDEALDETFPASDPIAITPSKEAWK